MATASGKAHVLRMVCCGKIVAAATAEFATKKDITGMKRDAKQHGDAYALLSVDEVREIGFTTHAHAVGLCDCDGNLTRAGRCGLVMPEEE